MQIYQKLSALYTNWQLTHPGHFVQGGVVDEEMFDRSEVKLLFLLKEVNDTEQKEDWSLVQLIQDQMQEMTFYQIWKTIGLWSFGLQQGFPHYQTLTYRQDLHIADGLREIAIINLKKSGGGGVSNYEEIKEHAEKNKELWMKEIEIIHPDVVVCGGTFSIIQEILGFEATPCGSGVLTGKALNTLFIDFYHPMYRISPKVLYAYFKETMQSLGY